MFSPVRQGKIFQGLGAFRRSTKEKLLGKVGRRRHKEKAAGNSYPPETKQKSLPERIKPPSLQFDSPHGAAVRRLLRRRQILLRYRLCDGLRRLPRQDAEHLRAYAGTQTALDTGLPMDICVHISPSLRQADREYYARKPWKLVGFYAVPY